MRSGFTGISYPFRITNRGGVAMSTTGVDNPQHIVESIIQIFSTNYLERPMEGGEVHNTIFPHIFDPDDIALQQVLRTQMVRDLERLEPRVKCEPSDIEFVVEVDRDTKIRYLYALMTVTIIKYSTTYTARIRMGEVNNEQTAY